MNGENNININESAIVNNQKNYKSSKYNWYYLYDNTCLILHTLNWKIYKVSTSTFKYLQSNSILQKTIPTNQELMYLHKEGLILEDVYDEDLLMHHYLNSAKYNKELQVTIIPTEACNFRCVYCYQDHKNGFMDDESEARIIKFFQKNMHLYESVSTDWFGGEPLLQKDRLIRIAQAIKNAGRENHIPVIGNITTNGYLLDYETFEKLVSCNILYYQISLDGPKSIHDIQRPHVSGKGSYDVIVNNLIDIKTHSKKQHFKILIRVNISKDNSAFMESFIDQLEQIFNDDKRFIFLMETVKDWGGSSVKQMDKSLFDNRNQIEDILNKGVQSKLTLYDGFFEGISNRICYSNKSNGFVLNYDGCVYKCAKAMYENSEIRDTNKIGELYQNGKMKIDERKKSQWLSGKNLEEKCEGCSWLPVCLSMYCPLTKVSNKKSKCFIEENGVHTLNDIIRNAYKRNKYITIGE